MHPRLHELRRKLKQLRIENAQVADEAYATSMQRILVLGPILVLVYALNAISYAIKWIQTPAHSTSLPWAQQLTALFCSALLIAIFIVTMSRLMRHVVRAAWHPWFVGGVGLLGLLITAMLVAINQQVTPSTSPFTLACMALAVGLYLRPRDSARIYLLGAAAFYMAMVWSQVDPNRLMTNLLNGIGSCVIGWAVSCLLFRNFVTIALQRDQLLKAHAELLAQQDMLKRQARHDGLTGLYNRTTFAVLATQELRRAQRQGSATTILLLDLDHFKRINDTWGHPAGDAVLRHVATLASATVRTTDLVGRLGGEEFIVLLPNTSAEAGRRLAEKLRARLEASVVQWEGTQISVTASVGLASATPDDKRDFDHLYTEADKALYLAKQRGRNRVM